MHTMEYYSAIKKNEVATIWMDLEGVMLSDMSDRKTNTVCYHLYVESKKLKQMNECNKTEIDSQT